MHQQRKRPDKAPVRQHAVLGLLRKRVEHFLDAVLGQTEALAHTAGGGVGARPAGDVCLFLALPGQVHGFRAVRQRTSVERRPPLELFAAQFAVVVQVRLRKALFGSDLAQYFRRYADTFFRAGHRVVHNAEHAGQVCDHFVDGNVPVTWKRDAGKPT